MLERLTEVVGADPRIAYALVFGSTATETAHALSDIDVAIGLIPGASLDLLDIGRLASELEAVALRPVDLVLLDEAPPGLAYRVFRGGRPLFVRDRPALAARQARAVLEYLDFRPVEELCARGVLAAARRALDLRGRDSL